MPTFSSVPIVRKSPRVATCVLGLIPLLFVFLITVAATSAQTMTTDYDPSADFSSYQTFMWIQPPHIRADPLMEPRLVSAINAALISKLAPGQFRC